MGLRAVPARHPRAGGGLASVGAVTGKRAAAVRMVRAGLQAGVAPGFRANVVPGGKLDVVTYLQPVHGPAKCNSRGPLPSSFTSAAQRQGRPQSATGRRAFRNSLPAQHCLERMSAGKGKQSAPASRIASEIRQPVHETIREETCQPDRIKLGNYNDFRLAEPYRSIQSRNSSDVTCRAPWSVANAANVRSAWTAEAERPVPRVSLRARYCSTRSQGR